MKEEKVSFVYVPDWFSIIAMGVVGLVVVITLTWTYWRLEKHGKLF